MSGAAHETGRETGRETRQETSSDFAAAPTVLMVAPNGARKTKADHPALPLTLQELVATARDCAAAGADALHLHVRDAAGAPSLDAGRYREAFAAIEAGAGPALALQASTETVGGFAPCDIDALLKGLRPNFASLALRDLAPRREDESQARKLLAWAAEAGVGLQHILYEPADLTRLARLAPGGHPLSLLFVLGRYAERQTADPAALAGFIGALSASPLAGRAVWMACAFGATETRSLIAAAALGGHCRVGFENNLVEADGAIAADNAARVSALRAALAPLGLRRAAPTRGLSSWTRRVLGGAP